MRLHDLVREMVDGSNWAVFRKGVCVFESVFERMWMSITSQEIYFTLPMKCPIAATPILFSFQLSAWLPTLFQPLPSYTRASPPIKKLEKYDNQCNIQFKNSLHYSILKLNIKITPIQLEVIFTNVY